MNEIFTYLFYGFWLFLSLSVVLLSIGTYMWIREKVRG